MKTTPLDDAIRDADSGEKTRMHSIAENLKDFRIEHYSQLAEKAVEIERLKAEVKACLRLIPEAHRIACCEGGGPENICGSLALSIARLASESKSPWITMPCKEEELPSFNDDVLIQNMQGYQFFEGISEKEIAPSELMSLFLMLKVRRFMIIPK